MKILLVGSHIVNVINPTPIEFGISFRVPVNQYLLAAKTPNTNLIRTGSIAGIPSKYFFPPFVILNQVLLEQNMCAHHVLQTIWLKCFVSFNFSIHYVSRREQVTQTSQENVLEKFIRIHNKVIQVQMVTVFLVALQSARHINSTKHNGNNSNTAQGSMRTLSAPWLICQIYFTLAFIL